MSDKKYPTPAELYKSNYRAKMNMNPDTKFMIMIVMQEGETKEVFWKNGKPTEIDPQDGTKSKTQLIGKYLVYNPDDDLISFVWKSDLSPPWIEQLQYTILTWDNFKETKTPLHQQWIKPDAPKEGRDPFSIVYEDKLLLEIEAISKGNKASLGKFKSAVKLILDAIDAYDADGYITDQNWSDDQQKAFELLKRWI